MFNILKSDKIFPEKIDIYITSRNNLIVKLKLLRKIYFKKGWEILSLKNKIAFLPIDEKNIEEKPPLLEECLLDDSVFNREIFKWRENVENQNQFIHSLFSSLQYKILGLEISYKFKPANNLGLNFKRDFLKREPILSTSDYQIFEGIKFIPSMVLKDSDYFISFIVLRVIRTKGSIRGSPRDLQKISQLSTSDYFKKLSALLKELIGERIECVIGNISFVINNQFETLKLKNLKELNILKSISSNKANEYYEDFMYIDEFEESFDNEEEDEELGILENEIINYILPLIPSKIEYGVLKEPALWVGGNQKVSNSPTLYLLNQYGPYFIPDRRIVIIPLYPDDQPQIKDKISRVASYITSGSGSGRYDFPGLIKGFNLKINLVNPIAISLKLSKIEFERKLNEVLRELEQQIPNLAITFKLNSSVIPFFLIGFEENVKNEWGKFTPIYQYFKENLTGLGYPNQVIKKFNQFFGNYKSFPLWSSSSAIFSKIGGIPWQIEANCAKNGSPIDAIIGYRFARRIADDNHQFILGIATVFSGNGKYLGFKTKSIPIEEIGEKYGFILKSHGFSRRYEGLKIPSNEVKSLFSDAEAIIDRRNYHQEKPGAVVVHRLGSVSSEEADAFLECFKLSKYSAGALVSISEHPIRWCFDGHAVNRGTWINLNSNSGILFPQGLTDYYQGNYQKPYIPKSIPRAFKIRILRDNGVYKKPHDAGYDVMALSRMNWRHTTFIPSNYPISLQYALIIAGYLKNGIKAMGDLNETPWFL